MRIKYHFFKPTESEKRAILQLTNEIGEAMLKKEDVRVKELVEESNSILEKGRERGKQLEEKSLTEV